MFPLKKKSFEFDGLFIFDMANNHKGSLELGRLIVREFAWVAKEAGVRAAIKFQFRDLEALIHPYHRRNSEYQYISYFLANRLRPEHYAILVRDIKEAGLVTMATPSDEQSVELLEKLGIEVIKVASSGATDWPLLEKIAETGKPVICSTAGLSINEVDKIVSFFEHRGTEFALEHCVSIYPTPSDKLNLERIAVLKNRYPQLTVGFSTHEDPNNVDAIKIAFSKGARIFERHIGVELESVKLNAYSSRPEQIRNWLVAYQQAVSMAGRPETSTFSDSVEEEKSLRQFQRGVYASRFLRQGAAILRPDVFFALPLQPGQLKSGEWQEDLVVDRDYAALEPLSAGLQSRNFSKKDTVYRAIREVKGMLNSARIFVNYDSNVELSHHYGLEKFFEVGAFLIECINREYCKKIIVMLPGQAHPIHYHKKKEETFQVLSGVLHAEIEGRTRMVYPGDTLLIPRGVWHGFFAPEGAIFEEISTTHWHNDSFYADKDINKEPLAERKTSLINWGRHQFDDLDEKQKLTIELL